MKDYRFLRQKYLLNTYANRGLVFTKGKGVYLYDQNGNRYLDLMTNIGAAPFGYNHPQISKTVSKQFATIHSLHGSFTSDIRAEASQALIKNCGQPYTQVYWGNSGTEAVEAALKLAVLATKRHQFVYCQNSYHGKTLGSLSVMGVKKYRQGFEPLLKKHKKVPFGNFPALTKAITKDTAAFIIEPIQGEGGLNMPPAEYLTKASRLCKQKGALLIFDEIQTGLGRTGSFLNSQSQKVSADIVCLGKALGAGLPVSATVITQAVADKIPKGAQTSTYGGNPLVCAVAKKVLSLINDKLLKNIAAKGNYFVKELKKIPSKRIVEVRGQGLMIGVEVSGSRDQVLKNLQTQGVLAAPAADQVVRFLPPYIVTKAQLKLAAYKLAKSL